MKSVPALSDYLRNGWYFFVGHIEKDLTGPEINPVQTRRVKCLVRHRSFFFKYRNVSFKPFYSIAGIFFCLRVSSTWMFGAHFLPFSLSLDDLFCINWMSTILHFSPHAFIALLANHEGTRAERRAVSGWD